MKKLLILIFMVFLIFILVGCVSANELGVENEAAAATPIPTTPYPALTTPPQALAGNATGISAGAHHTLALLDDNTLWAWGSGTRWGWNEGSLIGDGTNENRPSPVKIMENIASATACISHSLAIDNDGVLWAWGNNVMGQLGDGTSYSRYAPVRIMDDVRYAVIAPSEEMSHVAYSSRSFAIRYDNSLWAWGSWWDESEDFRWFDIPGYLGDGGAHGSREPVMIMENVAYVAPTLFGGYAITTDGVLWGWGRFSRSWEANSVLYPVQIMENIALVHSNLNTAFAITNDAALWLLGPEPRWLKDDVIFATGDTAIFFAITSDNTLWAWGRNRLPDHWRPGPPLGDGTTVDREEPVKIMENVAHVYVLGNVAYAITLDGELWAWGNNGGALGSGIIGDGALFVWDDIEDHMWEFAYDYIDGHEIPSGIRWLLDNDGGAGLRLSPVLILENVVYVTANYSMFDHGWIRTFRTFALTSCGSVWAWGENDDLKQGASLLGDSTTEQRLSPVRIIGNNDAGD